MTTADSESPLSKTSTHQISGHSEHLFLLLLIHSWRPKSVHWAFNECFWSSKSTFSFNHQQSRCLKLDWWVNIKNLNSSEYFIRDLHHRKPTPTKFQLKVTTWVNSLMKVKKWARVINGAFLLSMNTKIVVWCLIDDLTSKIFNQANIIFLISILKNLLLPNFS